MSLNLEVSCNRIKKTVKILTDKTKLEKPKIKADLYFAVYPKTSTYSSHS